MEWSPVTGLNPKFAGDLSSCIWRSKLKHRRSFRRRYRAHSARKTNKGEETFTNQTKGELGWSFIKSKMGGHQCRTGTVETKLERRVPSSTTMERNILEWQKEQITLTMETKSRKQLEIECLVHGRRQIKKQGELTYCRRTSKADWKPWGEQSA